MNRGIRGLRRVSVLAMLAGAAGANLLGADCASCHKDEAAKLGKSAHAELTCDTCHERHDQYPHPAGVPKPECATCHTDQAEAYAGSVHAHERQTGNEAAPDCAACHGSAHELVNAQSESFRSAEPDTCGMCHTDEAGQYRASVHGQAAAKGIPQAPVCTDCHGEHKIIRPGNPASPVNAAHIRDTCGGCHGNVRLAREFDMPTDRLVSFDASYHGLAAKAGDETVANCASCHGVHNILPSSDAKSTINPNHLGETCGKCHPGAGTRFAITQVHLVDNGPQPAPLRWVRQFYLLLIPVTIGLMLLHNLGDWLRKLIGLRFTAQAYLRRVAVRGELRMLPFERVQHAVLAISFFFLVWTGFALKYPDQAWARPLLVLEGAHPIRSLVHRVAAAVFVLVSLTHLISLFVSRRLRHHWLEMLPNANDPREAMANFAYNLGLGEKRPARSPHSYIEKAEYWAVVWGAAVMIATGGLLWANTLALKYFPKIWLDVATSVHFYEALLATLAIVVWHFYSIIFDPDVYPLNTAFLTGFGVQKEDAERIAHTAGGAKSK